MDLSVINTVDAASEGAFLHLRHPVLKHLLYTGAGADPATGEWNGKDQTPKAVGLMVRGREAKAVQAKARLLQKASMKNKGANDDDNGMRFVCSLVISFVGFERDGKPMEATEENKVLFFETSDDLVRQVLDFTQDNANFFQPPSIK